MMRRARIICFTAFCCALPASAAAQQEAVLPDELERRARIAADELFSKPAPAFDTGWLREEVNPVLRERRRLRRLISLRARQTAPMPNDAGSRDPEIGTGRWRITIGNSTEGNWSPYPDRALDARALRFPMPRNK